MRRLAAAALGVLALWAFLPVVLLVAHADSLHATWTGADGLIGADGVLGADQLQYLAWARSIAGHGLAADLFTLGRSGHVFLEPASGIVGGLLALGIPLVVGSLVVKALAVGALAIAAVAWCARCLPGSRGARTAAVALALFLVTPATSIVNWTQLGSAHFRFATYLAGDELLAATKLWGYAPAALAIALLVAALLGLESTVAAPPGARGPRLALTAAAALGCAWLHPWQGITLAIIVVALAGARRGRREWPALAVVLVAVCVPLAYYGVLAHADPAWRIAAANETGPRLPAGVLALCVGPLVVLAALGVRRPGAGAALTEQALLAWIPAALITYFVEGAFATHALEGLSFPVAVLAVRGARRVRLGTVAGTVCVLALTVPGLAYAARKFVRTGRSGLVQYALPADDAAALHWVAHAGPPGGVLAPVPFAAVIPSVTGRAVWVGHGDWSPDYPARAAAVRRLFDGRMSPPTARRFVLAAGARLLVADCAHPRLGPGSLGSLVASVHRFGCARVIVLRPPPSRTGGRP